MAEILVEGLVKTFRDAKTKEETKVLKSLDFDVEEGTFVAILGASGSGKSTLLRLIAGLEGSTEGRITIAGEDVTGLPAAERELAMVFQNYALFPHLTVAENIVFGLKARKVDPAIRQERMQESAKLMELDHLLNRKPAALSGGQRQRVALARALVSGHKLVLMDEPLSNLDARLRAEMRRELRRLQVELGLTVLYVTHDQVEAMTMADKVLVMGAGFIEQYAPPTTLYNHPASMNVARFIGSPPMNLLQIPVNELAQPAPTAAIDNDEAVLGVRPENIQLDPSDDSIALCDARVNHHELLGSDRLFFVSTNHSNPQEVTIRTNPEVEREVGSTVSLYSKPAHLRWFNPSTGAAATI